MSARLLAAAALLLLLLAPAGAAWACDPALPSAWLLLPEAGAGDVPTDAVLVARAELGAPTVSLQEEASGQDVALAQECEAGGTVCRVRPAQPLAAHTAYRWRAALRDPPDFAHPPREGRFTTGAGPAAAASPPALHVTHGGFAKGETSCGPYDNARLTLRLEGPGAPGVLLLWPQDREPREALAAEAPRVLAAYPSQEVGVPRELECVAVVHLDPAGRRAELGRHCPQAAPDGFLGGCAAGGAGGPALTGGLLLVLAGLRRRRIPR